MELMDRAKVVGCLTEFKKMLSAYKKEKSKFDKKNNIVPFKNAENVTEFGEEFPELRCGQWKAGPEGVSIITVFGEKIACPHPIGITKILINAETNFCKVVLMFYIRSKWHEITLDKEIISSATKIVSLSKYGVIVTSETAKYLVQYLADLEHLNEDKIIEYTSTSKVGWVNGHFMPYCNNIIFDNEQNLKQAFDSIKASGSKEKWYKLAKEIRASGRFEPKIYIAGALASVLVEPLSSLPFIINLYGSSGKGKTVALMLAASVWANPEEGKFISDPKSTPTALEVRLDFLNSLPLLLDDMAQIKTKKDYDLSSVIYYWCSGKGKDRSNRSLGLNAAKTWRNCIITNGEHSLVNATMQGGAVNRIIDIEIDDGYIFENGNKTVEILKRNYGFCGLDFVNLIQAIGFDRIREIQKDFYDKIVTIAKLNGCEKEEKQIYPMSIILTADKLATENLFQDKQNLDINKCVDLLKSVGEVSEVERCYNYLVDTIAINVNKFEPDDDGNYRGEQWGVIEDNTAIIIGTAFDRMVEQAGFNTKTFLSWAVKNNVVKTDARGNAKKVKSINGKSIRCVFMDLEKEEFEQIEISPFDVK